MARKIELLDSLDFVSFVRRKISLFRFSLNKYKAKFNSIFTEVRKEYVGLMTLISILKWWEHRDLNPDRLVSSDPPLSFVCTAGGGSHRSVFQLIITIFRPLPFVIPVQLEPAILPGYTILPRIVYPSASLLSLSASTLTTS